MDKLLLEFQWLPKVFEMSKEHGLDWLVMAALALELSGGDPRCRVIDWDFLEANLGPDSPLAAGHYTGIAPDVFIIDRATRWGLFQIYGQVAIDKDVFTGRMINFTDIGANARAACQLMESLLKDPEFTLDDAIIYFGADPKSVHARVDSLRESLNILLSIGQVVLNEQD